ARLIAWTNPRDFFLRAESSRTVIIAEQNFEGVAAPDFVRSEIPFPDHFVRRPRGQLETFFARAQGVSSLNVLPAYFGLAKRALYRWRKTMKALFNDIIRRAGVQAVHRFLFA